MKIRVINSNHISPEHLTAVMDLLQSSAGKLDFISPGYKPHRSEDDEDLLMFDQDSMFAYDISYSIPPGNTEFESNFSKNEMANHSSLEIEEAPRKKIKKQSPKIPSSPVVLISDEHTDGILSRFFLAIELLNNLLRQIIFYDPEISAKHAHSSRSSCLAIELRDKDDLLSILDTDSLCGNCRELTHMNEQVANNIEPILEHMKRVRESYQISLNSKDDHSPLTLTIQGYMKDFFIKDLGNLRIQFTPLEKTLYLIFLKYPEGIKLTHLADHFDEMREIYKEIGNPRTMNDLDGRIKDLANPFSNSTSEKISKIKSKLEKYLGVKRASNYIIAGERAEEKKIILDRSLVKYEK